MAHASLLQHMRAPRRLMVVILAALTGVVLMLLQARQFFRLRSGTADFNSYCSFGTFDCHAVEVSRYAEFLPGYPLAGFAVAYLAGLAVIALFARDVYWRREAVRVGTLYGAFGVLFSASYFVIMATQLSGLCAFCLAVDGIIATSFGIFLSMGPESPKKHALDNPKWMTMGKTLAGSSLALLILVKLLDSSPSIPAEQARRAIEGVMNAPVTPVPMLSEAPSSGPAEAAITIVKFSDFQCPACKVGAQSIHPLSHRFPGKIRIVYRHFPLDPACNRGMDRPLHPAACQAARVSHCAFRKGKFKEAYEALFEHQEDLVKDGPAAIAAKATGIPIAELEACATGSDAQTAIARDVEDGMALEVSATPTFFINGRKVPGGLPTDLWIEVIEKLLAAGK
ncbi:MAG: thioredoxin domain-containing protein [Bdellovibrionales bacterium]|nr:thioredoxin domain-containing protein [Bdellovibrionales bacterium]